MVMTPAVAAATFIIRTIWAVGFDVAGSTAFVTNDSFLFHHFVRSAAIGIIWAVGRNMARLFAFVAEYPS